MKDIQSADAIEIVFKLFLAAVSDTASGEIPHLQEKEWEYILGICAAQNIHSLVFDFLPENLPCGVYDKWKALADSAGRQNELIRRVTAKQEEVWKRLGLKYVLLKGDSLAGLYPYPEHRGPGDVDWCFLDEHSFGIARSVAERNAEKGIHFDSDGDFNYIFNGVVIEHHRDWTHLSSRKLRFLVGNPTVMEGRLSPVDTLIMLEMHILHHLAYRGVGLKQFADLAVAFRHFGGRYDSVAFAERLGRMGMPRWDALLHRWLDEPLGPDSDVQKLTGVILGDGCVQDGNEQGGGILLTRASLLWKMSKREFFARYFHLSIGRFSRKIK